MLALFHLWHNAQRVCVGWCMVVPFVGRVSSDWVDVLVSPIGRRHHRHPHIDPSSAMKFQWSLAASTAFGGELYLKSLIAWVERKAGVVAVMLLYGTGAGQIKADV